MADPWQRFKQRKLMQWAVAYVAAAFALLQGIDIFAQRFAWPDSIERILLIASCVGFFVVLLLAWYHGERGAQKVSSTELAILSLLLAIGGALMWRFAQVPATIPIPAVVAASTPVAPTHADIPAKSIAVLPFENLSTDKGNAYFADGMQDLILTKLADIGELKVISRTSTMKYASHPDDLKTIAQQLGVATVLEGSVQKAGNQVLINVQLIDAQTDNHLWADSYTRTLDNIFGVEGEVAGKVADALKAKLSPSETAVVANVPTKNPAAYDAYLRGESYLDQMWAGNFAVVPKAVAAFREATDHDPQFALAWAQLALSQGLLNYASIDTSSATRQQALANAQHALALAPDLPKAHYALGYVYRFGFVDYDKALTQFKIAQRGSPNDAEVEAAIAYIEAMRGNEWTALVGLQRATTLNPRDPNLAHAMGRMQMDLRHYDRARVAFQRTLAIAPNDPEAYSAMARLDVLQHGDVHAALTQLHNAPTDLQSASEILSAKVQLLLFQRDYKAAQQAVDTLQPGSRFITPLRVLLLRAAVSHLSGDLPRAKALYQQAVTSAAGGGEVGETALVSAVSMPIAQAGLGHRAEALQALDDARAKLTKLDLGSILNALSLVRAEVDVMLGDNDAAIAALDKALAAPTGSSVSVPLLKLDPKWDPIRHDPRFQALLKKYGSGAPTQDAADNKAAVHE